MRQRLATTAILALAIAATGCSLNFDTTSLGVPVTMETPAGTPVAGSAFSVTSHSVHGFFGLLSLSKPSLRKTLAAQLVGGKGIADMRIKVRSRWSDVLITVLTLGLITPRTVTFEGVVVDQ